MNIDKEIEKLEKQLALLKNTKNKMDQLDDDIVNKKGDFKIKIYEGSSNEIAKYADTFKELYDFWKSKMNKTDYIFLEYYADKQYHSYEAKTYEEFIDIVKLITTLNAFGLVNMDFTICTKAGIFKYYVAIENKYLEFFYYDINHVLLEQLLRHFNITEDEYLKKIEDGKSYRLTFNEIM